MNSNPRKTKRKNFPLSGQPLLLFFPWPSPTLFLFLLPHAGQGQPPLLPPKHGPTRLSSSSRRRTVLEHLLDRFTNRLSPHRDGTFNPAPNHTSTTHNAQVRGRAALSTTARLSHQRLSLDVGSRHTTPRQRAATSKCRNSNHQPPTINGCPRNLELASFSPLTPGHATYKSLRLPSKHPSIFQTNRR